jgi:hypothetical protein
MDASDSALRSAPSLRTIARSAAGLAGVTGAYSVLALLGAFGPVACISESASGEGVSSEAAGSSGVTSTSGEAADGCVSGIDYLLSGGRVAPEFFAWPMVLLVFVALGVAAAWTGRGRATWLVAIAGVAISLAGFLSIGRYFALPALFLLVAAAALSAEARRGFEGREKAEA